MPYRTKRIKARAPRRRRYARTTRRNGGGYRSTRRGRGIRYRGRRRGVSTRSLLNITSMKKQDNMLSASNTIGTGASAPTEIRPLFINGSTGYGYVLWNATARNMVTSGAPNTITEKSDRTSTTCYMRGLREVLRIQTSTPLPWVWRRICFTTKDDIFTAKVNGDQAPTNTYRPYFDNLTGNIGMMRNWFNMQVNNMPNTVDVFNGIIFQGENGKDWSNILNAKTDSTRISLKSDTQISLHTGNQSGYFKTHKRWYPMNKNLVYDDDENGASETSRYFSTAAKPGMGDYYVLDIFVPGLGGTTSDLLNIDSQATLYWHEK
uniref:Capsid protein n=1 Tax=Genomoviridae sp. TaxID=2202565 RepID=A0A858NFE2_9VIRU|nr:MAG: capsid protein [Genomoviridae sp.]